VDKEMIKVLSREHSLTVSLRIFEPSHDKTNIVRLRPAGLDPCWSQTHYVGFVVTRLILFLLSD
jgi:hypothetical protein